MTVSRSPHFAMTVQSKESNVAVLCYLYLTQPSLHLTLYGQEDAGQEVITPVLVTDHQALSSHLTILNTEGSFPQITSY